MSNHHNVSHHSLTFSQDTQLSQATLTRHVGGKTATITRQCMAVFFLTNILAKRQNNVPRRPHAAGVGKRHILSDLTQVCAACSRLLALLRLHGRLLVPLQPSGIKFGLRRLA